MKENKTPPSNNQFVGYYEAVENPIDVIKIQQKLKTDEYANMDELKVGLSGPRV